MRALKRGACKVTNLSLLLSTSTVFAKILSIIHLKYSGYERIRSLVQIPSGALTVRSNECEGWVRVRDDNSVGRAARNVSGGNYMAKIMDLNDLLFLQQTTSNMKNER